MSKEHWPIPPLWTEDLVYVRQLLSAEEWRELTRRLVHLSDGRLVTWDTVLPKPQPN